MEIGKFMKVKGYKAEWSGEVEVIDAIWQFEDGEYIAEPEDRHSASWHRRADQQAE